MFIQMAARRRRMGGFSPLTLFAASEPGVWLDPSDLSTLFQDDAGTTPVTAAGQSVGMVRDKSGRGNHATQATAASRPIYGVVPATGRRNLLTYSEQIDNAAWSKPNASITPNASADPLGFITADRVANAGPATVQTPGFTATAGDNLTFSAWLRSATGVNQTVNLSISGAVNTPQTVTTEWQRFSVTWSSASAGTWNGRIGTTEQAYDVFAWGAQVEKATTASSYQRVVSQYDVTEAGLTSVAYLFDDLIDDALNWTAPAGNYTVAWCDTAGNVTIQTAQALSGATDALRTQLMVGYLAINRALTAAETANLTAWLQQKAGV